MRSSRRILNVVAALSATALLAIPSLAAVPGNGSIIFEVLRGDDPMGEHSLRFERRGEELHVFVDIELEVKLAFFTAFRYSHSNHEVWRDGRLLSIETRTDDDGTEFFVSGRATAEGFLVESKSGSELLPADLLPTSYWHPDTVERSRFLDTQKGQLVEMTARMVGEESLTIGNTEVSATRYRMTGDLKLDLWYAANGEWVKVAFEARGEDIDYLREDVSPQLAELAAE